MMKNKVTYRWGENPQTLYNLQHDVIKVQLVDAPSWDRLLNYIPEFVESTWLDNPPENKLPLTKEERETIVLDALAGKCLPTALETIRLTFLVSGLDLIDVTHLIRHRTLSFAAQCSGDRDLRMDDAVVKPSIMCNDVFFERFVNIVKEAKQLYVDMVDSKWVPLLDARTILPRCLSNFYFVSGNIKDIMAFIKTRKDEAIQPESDNLLAMRMWEAIAHHWPKILDVVDMDFGGTDHFYVKTAKGPYNSRVYMPKPANAAADLQPEDCMYQKTRDKFPGGMVYEVRKLLIVNELNKLKEKNNGNRSIEE